MRKIWMTLALSASLLLGLSLAPLQAGTETREIEKKQKQVFANIKNLRVDFEQTVYKKLRDRKDMRTGKAYFTKPNLFRWNFESKRFGKEEYYYDGKTLTHFKEREKLVNHYKANVGLANELSEVVSMVLDPKNLMKRYKLVKSEQGNEVSRMRLEPIQEGVSEIESILIQVADQDQFIQSIRISYMDGNYTQFDFKNPSKQHNSMDLFRFSREGSYIVRHHG